MLTCHKPRPCCQIPLSSGCLPRSPSYPQEATSLGPLAVPEGTRSKSWGTAVHQCVPQAWPLTSTVLQVCELHINGFFKNSSSYCSTLCSWEWPMLLQELSFAHFIARFFSPLCICIMIFIHSIVDGYLGYLWFLTIVSNTMNVSCTSPRSFL